MTNPTLAAVCLVYKQEIYIVHSSQPVICRPKAISIHFSTQTQRHQIVLLSVLYRPTDITNVYSLALICINLLM